MQNQSFPQISYLDGFRFQRAVLAGCKEVIAHEKELNRINVFPIPDRDTGSNLKKTFMPVLDKFPLWQVEISRSSRSIAETAISSASGYSGIIFAQFISGYAEGMKDAEKIRVIQFAEALDTAVARAYDSLKDPVEGTLLSVFREWADEVKRLSDGTHDFVLLLRDSLKSAARALMKTPEQLSVLRKHKVVDAGGKAFIYFLEGIIRFIEKGKLQPILPLKRQAVLKREVSEKPGEAQFCAECCVRNKNIDRIRLIDELRSLGQDLIFYSTSDFVKIHVKALRPEDVFSCAAHFGVVSSERILKFMPDLPQGEKSALALVSDTTCDISDEYIEHSDIYFVPVKIQISDRIFMDKVNLISEEFYRMMNVSSDVPKTSQPSITDFSRVYEHLLVHYQSIISLQLSKKLSGTFQTALQVARSIDPERITVVDGKSISVGLGLEMIEGVKAIREGLGYRAVLTRIEGTVDNLEVLIGIPTLKYLIKGGRVRKTKGLIGRILNINPILSINKKGVLEPTGKTRGKKKLVQEILNLTLVKMKKAQMTHPVPDSGEIPGKKMSFTLAVAHTNVPHLGQRIAEEMRARTGLKASMIINASPVLGAHAGPGAVGLAFLKTSH